MKDANESTYGEEDESSDGLDISGPAFGSKKFAAPTRSGVGHCELRHMKSCGASVQVTSVAYDDENPEVQLQFKIGEASGDVLMDVMDALELADDIEAVALGAMEADL